MKRLESSVFFQLTLHRIKKLNDTIAEKGMFDAGRDADVFELTNYEDAEFNFDDQDTEFFATGRKIKIDLNDMAYVTWRTTLQHDPDVLELLMLMAADITPEHDTKLQTLLKLIADKTVSEIEVIGMRLNQNSLDKRAMQVIDREIPHHILFLLIMRNRSRRGSVVRSRARAVRCLLSPASIITPNG